MDPLYSLCDVRIGYGNRVALEIARLDLSPEQIYLVTGANGAGKSTLLRLLALLEPPTSGRVLLKGVDPNRDRGAAKRLRHHVTMVHQDPYLFAGTVEHNLSFGLRQRGVRGAAAACRIEDALQRVGLEGFARRRTHQLSGGESHRVALARALVLEPQVLILDEPDASLDAASAVAFERAVLARKAAGGTVIMASHDPGQIDRLGAINLHLIDGRLSESPDPAPSSSSSTRRSLQYAHQF